MGVSLHKEKSRVHFEIHIPKVIMVFSKFLKKTVGSSLKIEEATKGISLSEDETNEAKDLIGWGERNALQSQEGLKKLWR
ncbi:hypothetical protein ACH5RR_026221 [Cinchona calisaya]|uniref:Uncharacterized protein n=1 Tax=Cinchona calisaya TaxID=153742 RepID=A0ABD2Z457_9GENT